MFFCVEHCQIWTGLLLQHSLLNCLLVGVHAQAACAGERPWILQVVMWTTGGTCLLWIDIGTVFPLLTRIYQIKHHIMYTVNFYYAFTVNVYWLDHASVYELIEVTIS